LRTTPNGTSTWTNAINCSSSPTQATRTAALADGLYLVADGKCLIYDLETGKLLHTFTFNATGATVAKDIRVDGDVIVVACSPAQEFKDVSEYYCVAYNDSAMLVCLDRKTGAELWRRAAKSYFRIHALAMWRAWSSA